jgi:UDP-glucose:(heptosyl)LPS alpha-1,3-glucosyltransferase
MSSYRRLFIVRRQTGGFGGAERVAAAFTQRLGEDWETVLVHKGSKVDGMKIGGVSGSNWLKALQFAKDTNKMIEKLRPDAVLSLERGTVCDVYRAGDGVHRRWMQIKYGKSLRWMLKPLNWVMSYQEKQSVANSRWIVANSEMVSKDMRGTYAGVEHKLSVIRNGFDPEKFSTDDSQDNPQVIGADYRYILFLGSGWERKGLGQAIVFLSELCSRDRDWATRGILIVAGTGRREQYYRLAEDLDVQSQVQFLGGVNSPATLCRLSELMVLPTSYDPFSNATLEALACGCPVVTTVCNGAHEVVENGRTGFILPRPEHSGIAEVARHFLKRPLASREEIAQSVASMTIDLELDKYCDLLDRLCGDNE